MKALTLFSSAGVGEAYFKDINIEAVCSCEILEKEHRFINTFIPKPMSWRHWMLRMRFQIL